MTMTTETKKNRTVLREDGLHIGTIIEQQKPRGDKPGHYVWYTAGGGGFSGSPEGALQAIHEELKR